MEQQQRRGWWQRWRPEPRQASRLERNTAYKPPPAGTVGGVDLVSDRTERSHRFVLTTAATVALFEFYHIPLGEMVVLGVKPCAALVPKIAILVLFYSSLHYLWFWGKDLVSWYSWNSFQRMVTVQPDPNRQPIIIEEKLRELFHGAEDTNSSKEGNLSVLKDTLDELKKFNTRALRVSRLGWIYLCLWHGTTPLIAAGVAFCLAWPGLPALLAACPPERAAMGQSCPVTSTDSGLPTTFASSLAR